SCPVERMIGHHFAEFLCGLREMCGASCNFKESIGNALGCLEKVGHVLNGDLQIVPIAGGIIWAGAKAFVWASAEHLDGVVVAVDFEQEVVRRAPGIDETGK